MMIDKTTIYMYRARALFYEQHGLCQNPNETIGLSQRTELDII